MNSLEEVCSVFLPENTLDNFDIIKVRNKDNEIQITLQEKNNPPDKGAKPEGFKEFMVSDFPIRNKKAILKYRRRYWKIKGQKGLITSDIPLVHTGTKLERAFAEVLKKRGGNDASFLGECSDFIPTRH
jgi:hypothetical protein